ncbi:MAG: nucleoside triphosphate pyrophosphohydrolase [Lachnospiraceae bacterium]|nr:nucleoside triphosphate pyrophosphohydrolase [Lachnospiraceae bacterium]
MKLVRDNIPDIIRESGRTPIYRKLDHMEYREYLNKKLYEEIEEYQIENQVEELCDVVEVIYALIEELNVSKVSVSGWQTRCSHMRAIPHIISSVCENRYL